MHKKSDQQREIRNQRLEKYLIEFNSSQLYAQFRQKLKKAVFRLAVEKYNKEVDHLGLTSKRDKEIFKAELYTFIQEQMKLFQHKYLEQALRAAATPQPHADLVKIHEEDRRRT